MCCTEGGKSVIVKYLTSSKLTRLQLRDAAFRRTLLLQCLVLLHACAHPILRKAKPGGAVGQKLPVPVLKEKQVRAWFLHNLYLKGIFLPAGGHQAFTPGIGHVGMRMCMCDMSCE